MSGLTEPVVFAIDDRVSISASDLRETGLDLEVGARGRAIALAATCEFTLGAEQLGVTVVVDADFAYLAGAPDLNCLLVTDHPSMEGYALSQRPLERLLRVSLHQPRTITPTVVRSAILPALRDVYAVRFALHQVSIACIDDIAGVCTLTAKSSGASIPELIRRSLTGLRKAEWPRPPEELAAAALSARDRMAPLDHTGRGHDIAVLLIAFLGLRGIAAHPDNVEMAMRTCFEAADLNGLAMFEALKARMAAA
jgi:hypothetical protein